MAFTRGAIRKIDRQRGGGSHLPSLDEFGNLTVSQWMPAYSRLASAGRLFIADTHAGDGKVCVTAMPTTSPEWGLYNASPSQTLVLLQVACSIKSTGATGLGLALVAAAAKGPQTAVTSSYSSNGSAVINCCNGSQRAPDVFITNNPTLVGGTPAWHVWDATEVNTVATDSVGDGLVANIQGALIARPRGMVAWEIVGEPGAGADTLFSVSAIFVMLDL